MDNTEQPVAEAPLEVEHRWEEVSTLYYARVPLGSWNWAGKLGLRVRILQLVAWALQINAIVFAGHKPISEAIEDGFKDIAVAVQFTAPLDSEDDDAESNA